MKKPAYDLRPVGIEVVRALCAEHHGYGSAGVSATYAWAVFEEERVVAAYVWQPPPPGAACAVCPEAPAGVLALSRMVAVPRAERVLNHVSRPLRHMMNRLIDRTRRPVLITFSDEGQGHTGHVYKCSGWEKTKKDSRPVFVNADGWRTSSYSNGKHGKRILTRAGSTVIQRWEHWICRHGDALLWMTERGWRRVEIPGKKWASGNPAYTYVRSGPGSPNPKLETPHAAPAAPNAPHAREAT